MFDDMFFCNDNKSLRRGRRRSSRTETCRPCLVWPKSSPELTFNGVAINMNPFGMLVRMVDNMPSGTAVMVQLMRDEDFLQPLTAPLEGLVVRALPDEEGFVDHGMKLSHAPLERNESRPMAVKRRTVAEEKPPSRMHTTDIDIGGRSTRRLGR
jgi:hypothetical protein